MYALALKGKTSPDLLTVPSSLFTTQGNRRDKPTIEFDPEIEKTLKKNRSRVKAQRALQFEQEEANSEEVEDKRWKQATRQEDESASFEDGLVS
ncbi:hypothetical protein PIB30_089240 [Stylosanthes scabra]|uniref:Uncharacterized protein n=1 Tax=Stylosanthes scabra TaxID=79078 RepID=A0ABU6ZSN8_9FABA|nr:hypothetical protein [Stylosanthes scabra]